MASGNSGNLFGKKMGGVSLGFAGLFFLAGIIFWGGFNTVMEATNTESFCISCHEMGTVYQEYKEKVHYSNRTGVGAVCSDCHVPREWGPKMLRKVYASKEIWGKLTGTIDTPEKFEAKRLQLAKNEWIRMKANDSLECRNCHRFDRMKPGAQKQLAQKQHANAKEDKKTCIDCHKGIAHKPIHKGIDPEEIYKP